MAESLLTFTSEPLPAGLHRAMTGPAEPAPLGVPRSFALAGHDAACFDRYGPPGETFTVHLGDHSALDLPILASAVGDEDPEGRHGTEVTRTHTH